MAKLTALPEPRFRVVKHKWGGKWYVQHYNNDRLRWEAYESISSTRVPIAKLYEPREKAVEVAERLNRRYPWKDFDRQLFARRQAGDLFWPSSPGDAEAIGQLLRERRGLPTP